MSISRRDFFRYSSGLAIGTGLAEFLLQSLAVSSEYKNQLDLPANMKETFTNSICGECGCGCGVRLRLIDGIPVSIEGNKLHPVNRGGVCVRGVAGLQMLYNPDRIKTPLQRTGERGKGQWQTSTWETALKAINPVITDILNSSHVNDVCILTDGQNDLLLHLLTVFSDLTDLGNIYQIGLTKQPFNSLDALTGTKREFAFDLEKTRYILSFGDQSLESQPTMGWYIPVFGQIRQSAPNQRAKIVQIDPQLSVSSIKADEWIPIRPGAYMDVALAIAHILILENYYDKDFVAKYVHGFEDWQDAKGHGHVGLRNTLLSHQFSPSSVAEKTGIDPKTITRIAREFANNRPALAFAGERILWHTNGSLQAEAVFLLNVLMGSIGTSGGMIGIKDAIIKHPVKTNPAGTGNARHTFSQITADDLLQLFPQKESYPKALLIFSTDPVYLCREPERLAAFFSEIPLIVSFGTMPDDTNAFADYILPDHHPFEKWQYATSPEGFAGINMSVSEPVLKPLYDTRDSCEILLTIMHEFDVKHKNEIRWQNSRQYIQNMAETIYKTGKGNLFSEKFDETWIALLEERGWRYPGHESFDSFWSELKLKGGWWQADYQDNSLILSFATLTKKIETVKTTESLQAYAGVVKDRISDEPVDHLRAESSPHVTQPQPTKGEVSLNIYQISSLGMDGKGAYSPMLLEISANHIKQRWESWMELNPETAKHLGINDHEWVYIVSGSIKQKVQVRHFPGARPDTVSVPLGFGHQNFGRYAKNIGINPLRLVTPAKDKQTGQVAWLETKVRIVKIENGESENA